MASDDFNEDFGRWYRSLDLGSDPETYDKRRTGTDALVKQTTIADLEALIRVAFKSRHLPPAEAIARLRQPFKAADETFAPQGNNREFQILAAAALAELLRRDGLISAAAALAVTTTSVAGTRRGELPLDLAEAAEHSLAAQGEATRARPNLSTFTAPQFPKAEFDKAVAAMQGQQDWNGVIAALNAVAEASRVSHTALWKRCVEALANAGKFIAVQDEELNMLWWLVGERSADLDQSFRKIPAPERTLVLGKELADLTVDLPGPSPVKSLLVRAGVSEDEKLSIPSCVNACDQDWLAPLVEGAVPSPVTRPLHLAIQRRIEAGDTTSWIAAWAATADLDATKEFPSLLIALLFYRERLLAKEHVGS